MGLLVKDGFDFLNGRHFLDLPSKDFDSGFAQSNVLVSIFCLPTFIIVACVVQFDSGNDSEVFQAHKKVHALSADFVEPRLPALPFLYPYDLRNLNLSEHYALRERLNQAPINNPLCLGYWFLAEKRRQIAFAQADFIAVFFAFLNPDERDENQSTYQGQRDKYSANHLQAPMLNELARHHATTKPNTVSRGMLSP